MLFKNRLMISFFVSIVYFFISLLLRLALLIYSYKDINLDLLSILNYFKIGLYYDLSFLSYFNLGMVLFLFLFPNKLYNTLLFKIFIKLFTFTVLFVLSFSVVAEILFWNEFRSRFNFIAVDYLVYTKEVLNNIIQSYPIKIIIAGIFIATCILYYLIHNKIHKLLSRKDSYIKRLLYILLSFSIAGVSFVYVNQSIKNNKFKNPVERSVSANGPYQLFASFRNNTLDYYNFYKTISDTQAFSIIKDHLKANNKTFKDQNFSIEHNVTFKKTN